MPRYQPNANKGFLRHAKYDFSKQHPAATDEHLSGVNRAVVYYRNPRDPAVLEFMTGIEQEIVQEAKAMHSSITTQLVNKGWCDCATCHLASDLSGEAIAGLLNEYLEPMVREFSKTARSRLPELRGDVPLMHLMYYLEEYLRTMIRLVWDNSSAVPQTSIQGSREAFYHECRLNCDVEARRWQLEIIQEIVGRASRQADDIERHLSRPGLSLPPAKHTPLCPMLHLIDPQVSAGQKSLYAPIDEFSWDNSMLSIS